MADSSSRSADVRAICLGRARSNAAIARHDPDGAVAEMMADCQVIASGGTLVPGRAAMRAAFVRAFSQSHFIAFTRQPDEIDIDRGGRVAAERGRWESQWEADASARRSGGVYLARWSKENDHWRIQSELFIPLDQVPSRA